jgi:SAM-dependent methyltransferase
VDDPAIPGDRPYGDLYRLFDEPAMRNLRAEAYGREIGQHSWVTAEELDRDVSLLGIVAASNVLDLGCGPGGPLTFVVDRVGCRGLGLDVSPEAVRSAIGRAEAGGVAARAAFQVADLDAPLQLSDGTFDTALALDVVIHLRDRRALFGEVHRVLAGDGRFLFTDAGVIEGSLSSDEVRRRSPHGATHLVPYGLNERLLEEAGFRLLELEDCTGAMLATAHGRLGARRSHRAELEPLEGPDAFAQQLRYLETVIDLGVRGSLRRYSYLAAR